MSLPETFRPGAFECNEFPNFGPDRAFAPLTKLVPPRLVQWHNSTFFAREGDISVLLIATLGHHHSDTPSLSLTTSHPDFDIDQVAWYTAWWALIPLAIAAMTQPCGRVLGQAEGNFRFYSRASPVFCIADVVHFIILIGLGFNLRPRLFKRNIKYELKKRFADSAQGDIAGAEKSRTIRWVLLALGGVPCQTVKLMVMEGVFWTKAWALIFALSIVFGEVVLVCARIVDTNHDIHLPKPKWRERSWAVHLDLAFHLPYTGHCHLAYGVIATVVYWLLFSVSTIDFILAMGICLVMGTTLSAILIAQIPSPRLKFMSFRPFFIYLVLMVGWECLHGLGWQKTRLSLPDWTQHRSLLDQYLRHDREPPKMRLADVLLPWTDIVVGLQPQTFPHVVHIAYEVWGAACLAVLVPRVFNLALPRRVLRVGSTEEARAVFVCVSTFLLSLLWYAFMFVPQGTFNPPWTKIFG